MDVSVLVKRNTFLDDSVNQLVSIVVPVFNAELSLHRCVVSLLNQSYRCIEVILIDDGSTDESARICDSFATADNRVFVSHIQNAGVGNARNLGLIHCRGRYVVFVDSDDYLEAHAIESLVCASDHFQVPLVISPELDEKPDGFPVDSLLTYPAESSVVHNPDYSFLEGYACGIIHGVLFRSDLIHDLAFATDLFNGEDSLFFAQALSRADSIAVIPDKLYHYVIYEESLSHGRLTAKRLTEYDAWKRIAGLFPSGSFTKMTAEVAWAKRCTGLLALIAEDGRAWRERRAMCLETLRRLLPVVLKAPYPARDKAKVFSYAVAPSVFTHLRSIRRSFF